MKLMHGFTLIEIAIVLVIIGLLAGGILKGQQMIENSKYKSFVKQIDEVRVAVNTFRERYKFYPGDHPRASSVFIAPSGVVIKDGNGNGVIEGGYCENAPDAVESCMLWQHLLLADLIAGDKSATGLDKCPKHAYGSRIGSVSQVWRSGLGYLGGYEILIMNVPSEVGQRLDEEMDDGKPHTGNIISASTYTTATSYSKDQIIHLAVRL